MAVGAEDAGRPRGAHAVGVQEDHDLPHGLLLGPALHDAGGAGLADALDLGKAAGRGLDDLEDASPKAATMRLAMSGPMPRIWPEAR